MINNVYLHSGNDEKKNIIKYIYMLIPFLLFGFYKNGISLYLNHTIKFIYVFKPILLTIISILISFIFSKWNKEEFLSYKLIANILISLITFPSTNIFIFTGLIFIINLLIKFIKIKINIIALYMVIYSIILIILNKYTYLNIYEQSYELKLIFTDYLLGKGPSGICSSLLIYIIICFILNIININYKRSIPIISLIIYYIFIFIMGCINNNFDPNLFLNNNLLFGVIFISPFTIYSTYSKGGSILYGTLLGIFLIISSFIEINLGVYISILLLSIISKYLDLLITHKK